MPIFGLRQTAERGFVEMIEMRVGQQHQVNRWQVLDSQAGPLDSFEQEEPVGEVGINQHVQIGELDEKRGVADPGDGHLAEGQFGKGRALGLAGAPGQQRLPDHLAKESARVEVLGRR